MGEDCGVTPSAIVMPWQDRLLKTNVPLTTQTLLPEELTLASTLKVFPTVLVKLAGEIYKEGLAAETIPVKLTINKETMANNIIFVLVFFIFLFYLLQFDINKEKSYSSTLSSLFKSEATFDPVLPHSDIIKAKSYSSTLLFLLISPVL